jgi:hypothetical protein
MTYIMTKENTGYLSLDALYMGFDNGEAVFYSVIGGEACRVS